MHADASGRLVRPTEGSSVLVRRVVGPTCDQLFVLSRPDRAGDAARQAKHVYEGLLDALATAGAGPDAVVGETVFLRRIRDGRTVRAARSQALGRSDLGGTTVIGQAPLDPHTQLELAAVAMIPHAATSWSAQDVGRPAACSCDVCAPGLKARVVRMGEQTQLRAGSVHGAGGDAFAEAYDMFRAAESLLVEAGMTFGNVVRTWIYLRDIDRDYDALNRARRAFFHDRGIELRPASTGIGGTPSSDAHDFSMGVYAIASERPLEVTPMSTPFLNEAWSYGADFSRGLKIVEANVATLVVSGTASIDDAGRTVHVGDFDAQAERMVENIASLLAGQGAGFTNLVSAVTYLRNPDDAPALRRLFARRGFDGFPSALVAAPLCRPELLCEAEAVAILPRATAKA